MPVAITDAAPAASGSGSAGGVDGGLRHRPHLEREDDQRYPAGGILALVWLVGIFTLAGGIALIVLAFKVRSVAKSAVDASRAP